MATAQEVGNAASAASVVEDKPQTIDVDAGSAIERLDSWIDGAIRMLPNIATAIVVVVLFVVISKFVSRAIIKQSAGRDRENLGEVLGGFVYWLLLGTGLMLAATIVIPTLKPGDLIAGLGVSSVAIGFAFKDILQNWMAGLLILLRQPFEIGDQIEVNGFEGTVERIETRATIIKTYDGQRVVVPNSDIYTHALMVKTAHDTRRSQYDVGIGYGDDIDEACEVIRKALEDVSDVKADPAPEAFPWDLAGSWVTIRVRWWTESRRADVVKVRSEVIKAIKTSLDEAHIDMPYETRVQLLHDQTEAGEGDRSKQREGWPVERGSDGTQPRWRAKLEAREETSPQAGGS